MSFYFSSIYLLKIYVDSKTNRYVFSFYAVQKKKQLLLNLLLKNVNDLSNKKGSLQPSTIKNCLVRV